MCTIFFLEHKICVLGPTVQRDITKLDAIGESVGDPGTEGHSRVPDAHDRGTFTHDKGLAVLCDRYDTRHKGLQNTKK